MVSCLFPVPKTILLLPLGNSRCHEVNHNVGRQPQPTLLNSSFVLDMRPPLDYLSLVRLQTLASPQRPQVSEEPVIPCGGFPLQLPHHSTGFISQAPWTL